MAAASAAMIGGDTWAVASHGVSWGVALVLAMALYGALFACLVPAARWLWTGTFPARAVMRWTPVAVCAWLSARSVLLWLWLPLLGLPLIVGVVFAVALGIAARPRMRRAVESFVAGSMNHPTGLTDVRDAKAMIDVCRVRLAEARLPPSVRLQVTVNLASALVSRSTLRDSADGLVEAAGLLESVVGTADDPTLVAGAAEQLATAMAVRARKHRGDGRALVSAMALWSRAIRQQGDPHTADAVEQFGRVLGDEHACVSAAVPVEAGRLHRDLVDRTRAAWRQAPPGSSIRDDIGLHLASRLMSDHASADELDESVALTRDIHARAQVRSAWLRGLRARAAAGHTRGLADLLATSLLRRASLVPGRADDDTAEALVLWSASVDHDPPDPAAALGVARALQVRAEHGLGTSSRLAGGRPLPNIPTAFRLAVEGWGVLADDGALFAAREWAEWAIRESSVDEAADALWHAILVAPADVSRLLTRRDREVLLASTQGLATEAGYWLTLARRERDAVVAVEYGRAILASLDEHPAAGAIAEIIRTQYAEATPEPEVLGQGFVSAEQVAWQGYDNLLREMRRTGRTQGRPAIPSYAELRDTVGAGLVIYIGAAERGGFALAVGPGHEPAAVPLPMLAATEVAGWCRRAAEARRPGSPAWPWTLDQLMAWLRSAFATPLVEALPSARRLTLIPLGLLGLLPLHATLDAAVSFAPNARIHAAARARAARTAGREPRVLVVEAARVPGWPALPWAAREAEEIAALHGSESILIRGATQEAAVRGMEETSVWHFACHGVARTDEPLDSALQLADGSLSLRRILASEPGDRRLAVLSACDTNVPDVDLLDEVVSLPGALLRAGTAGVVSSLWQVRDDAALYVMLRFHALFRCGVPPAEALADAQRWLRTVSNGELRADHPDLMIEPAGFSDDDLAKWRAQRRFSRPYYWAAFTFTGA